MKVLVLGWEYPPAVAGGLGAACHGLTTALADRGHEVVLCTPADGAPVDPAPYPGIVRVPLGSRAGFAPFQPGAILDPYGVDPASITTHGDPRGYCLKWQFPADAHGHRPSNSFGGDIWGV